MRKYWASACGCAFGLFFLLSFLGSSSHAQNGPCTSPSTVCVTTWQQDTYRTGQNLQEATIVAADGSLGSFGELCSVQLDGQVYGQPLVAAGVTINNTRYNSVVYVVTQNDTLYAIDGDPTDHKTPCGIIASLSFLTTGATSGQYPVDCKYVGGGDASCNGTIGPFVGILGTPVMTTNAITGSIYLVTETQDLNPANHPVPTHWFHYLHAVDIQSMQEILPAVRIFLSCNKCNPDAFSQAHIQRPGLLYLTASQARLNDPMVYVAFSMMDGAGTPNPAGVIFSYDALTLAPQSYFVTSSDGGGIWMGGGAPAYGFDKNGDGWIYLTTANGAFNPGSGDRGDSLLMLDPSTLNVAKPTNGYGYFTPADQYYRSAHNNPSCTIRGGGDVDFGSGSVLLLPDRELANFGFVAVNGDKEGGIWFMDRTNPNGYNAEVCVAAGGPICPCKALGGNNIQTVWTSIPFAGKPIHNGLAFWRRPSGAGPADHYLYVVPCASVLKRYELCASLTASGPICNEGAALEGRLSGGQPASVQYGATPSISAASSNATDAILWMTASSKDPQPTESDGTLLAFDAVTMRELYSSHTCKNRDGLFPTTKFLVPTVANGNVYVTSYMYANGQSLPNGMFYIFGMNAGACQ